MAFEAKKETVNSCYKKSLGSKQTRVEHKLNSKDNTTIAKVLCIKAEYLPKQPILAEGNASKQGEVRFEVVYSSEDGLLYTINDIAKVDMSYDNENIEPTSFPLTKSEIVDLSVVSVRPNNITLSGVINCDMNVINCDEVRYLSDVTGDVVGKVEMLEYCEVKSQGNSIFDVEEEFEIKEEINQLLMATTNLCVKEVYAGTGYITLKGEVKVNLTYETTGEDKEIKSITKTIPFKEEIDAEGTVAECNVDMVADVVANKVNVFANNIDDAAILKMNVPIEVVYSTMCKNQVPAVIDAFSLTHDINMKANSFNKCKYNMFNHYHDTVSVSADLNNPDYEIESLAADCGGTAFVAKAYAEEGYVTVEGVAKVNVIYNTLNENEELMYESMSVEIPFSTDVECPVANNDSYVMANVSIKDVAMRAKRGKEIDVDMDLCINYSIWDNEQDMVMSDLEMGEALTEESASMKMYLVKEGSTLWDVCKHVCADPETVKQQNPELDFPLKEDTFIILYKQREEMY